jgi:phosphopantetheinyl transferase
MSHVIVLQAGLAGDRDSAAEHGLLQRLPYARRLELERRDESSRGASLAALGLVLKGLSQLRGRPVRADELHFPQGGKPYCDGDECFSISHTSRRVAVALSRHCEVGVDVEELDSAAGPDAVARGKLAQWTATEAVLKAAGLGLRHAGDVALELDAGRARLAGREFFLRRLPLGPEVIAHLATAGPVESVRIG